MSDSLHIANAEPIVIGDDYRVSVECETAWRRYVVVFQVCGYLLGRAPEGQVIEALRSCCREALGAIILHIDSIQSASMGVQTVGNPPMIRYLHKEMK